VEKSLNYEALFFYLQLNYVPAPNTMLKGIRKLLPGHSIRVTPDALTHERWYKLSQNLEKPSKSYEERKARLADLLEASVRRRLLADVPLGAFLSGGIDSSVIAALAARQKSRLHSFSIGFADEPFFDETEYARLVARKIGTDHTVFSLTNRDLYQHLDEILDYFDEPFADSSAIAVYILSCETRKHSTVALSGDGADEMFAGYNKHMAFYRAHNAGLFEKAVGWLHPVWSILPKSRSNRHTNFFRQVHRFSEGLCQDPIERYWQWASVISQHDAAWLLTEQSRQQLANDVYLVLRDELLGVLRTASDPDSMNSILYQDVHMVLPNDMLVKVDLMSMANSLEVRVPFLDHEIVEYVFSLSEDDKIGRKTRKRILQDTFSDVLPKELHNRPKKGFEVPLLGWFRNEMRSKIFDDLLSDRFVVEQGLFSVPSVRMLKRRLFSTNPGDVHAQVWALVCFQSWWRNYMV
jgi:asparagine synthase (glutamine-hydrolysing)